MSYEKELIPYIERQISRTHLQVRSRIRDNEGTFLGRRSLYPKIMDLIDDLIDGRNPGSRWVSIPGFRGTGKTTLLSQIWYELSNERGFQDVDIPMFSMDEVSRIIGSDLYQLLNEYQRYRGRSLEEIDNAVVVFVDEVHYDPKWDTTIKTMVDRTPRVMFIVTGSSAIPLQSGADSARRMTLKKMLPLSMREWSMLERKEDTSEGKDCPVGYILFRSRGPEEVLEGLESMRDLYIKFWDRLDPLFIERYLIRGSLPFSMGVPGEEDVFERTIQILEKVIYQDIPEVSKLNSGTLNRIWNLISILADSREISLDSLSNKLDLGKPTVFKIMKILEDCEIIFQVKAYGPTSKQITKSPKYPFISPTIRAALKWKMGLVQDRSALLGELLEDAIGGQLKRICIDDNRFKLYHPSGKGQADYVLTDGSGEGNIIIEVGYGKNKEKDQVKSSMKKIPSKYGLVISRTDIPRREEDVVFVPLKYFFMI